ncbi:flagellar brake protein [Massilia sp. DWR3-1-1]|uniref:flagellar brake protein n=1 Tax=Massilia sp. DWR3-1-1 TaxID=2804559 RepID=UPI003CEFB9C4
MENWHDFEVGSRREVVAILRAIADKNQLVRMLVQGENDVCVTSILHVDADAGTLVLDRSINAEQNARIVQARRISFETSLDKIRILFASESVRETIHVDGAALVLDLPATMIRLQRREFYRMSTPVSTPLRVTIPIPYELGGGNAVLPLSDISCGGVCVFDNKFVLGNTIGKNYENCRIELPDIGMVATTLQVRNSIDMTLLNNKANRRLGCQFLDMSRASAAAVQRYITRLERERNARIAGLS